MCLYSAAKKCSHFATFVIVIHLSNSFVSAENMNVGESFEALLSHIPNCTFGQDINVPCIVETNCTVLRHKSSNRCVFSIYSDANFDTDGSHNYNLNIDNIIENPRALEVWIFGLLSAFAISFSGVVGYVLAPLITSSFQHYVLNTLIGLAFGSLTSTALLQLIPEAYHIMSYVEDYLHIALFTVLGIWLLYIIQTLTSIIFDEKKLEPTSNHHHHIFHPMKTAVNNKVISDDFTNTTCYHEQGNDRPEAHNKSNNNITYDSHKLYFVSETENNVKKKSESNSPTALAWLIILGDGLHNFIDGVSIGAGYTQSLTTGFSMTLAIACEEYPHELGDFAILLQSGLSIKKAAIYNYLSATAIIVGVVIGIILGELQFSPFIFSSSAGLFLYISLSNLMPELKDMIAESLILGKKSALRMLLCQCIGFTMGFSVLFLITSRNHSA